MATQTGCRVSSASFLRWPRNIRKSALSGATSAIRCFADVCQYTKVPITMLPHGHRCENFLCHAAVGGHRHDLLDVTNQAI